MEFRLTYKGPLVARQGDPMAGQSVRVTKAENQHNIRSHFHWQLKRLWDTTPFLRDGTVPSVGALLLPGSHPEREPISKAALAQRHSLYGHQFVPLVSNDLLLRCELEILFLRPDLPDRTSWGGDIDNRMKTLLDALRIPEAGEDYGLRKLDDDKRPMFCLLEDDKLISRLSVETDQLLDVGAVDKPDIALVITVRIRPYHVIFRNLNFV
jgi:hypothetical protein